MEARRPQLADLGVFLLVVAAPLVFTPFTVSPFGDPKLVLVVAASLALWGSGLPLDRGLAWRAGAWVAATALAALFGTDVARGLTASVTSKGGGLIVTLAAAVLLLAGVALDETLRERARRWFVAASCAIAVFAVLVRLLPGTFGSLGDLSFIGATMGNPVFGAALLSAGLACAMARRDVPLARLLPVVGLLALAIATFGERSALILPAVATAAFLWRARLGWRRSAALAGTVLLVLVLWQFATPHLPHRGTSATVRVQLSDTERTTVWRVLATRAVPARPILGWGPAQSQTAYLTEATGPEVHLTGRGWASAHDLPLETLVSSGVIGLATFLAFVGLALFRAVRCPPERAWAFGAAAALGTYALYEPINLVLTPLLFFMSGVAAGWATRPAPVPRDKTAPGATSASGGWTRVAHIATTVGLSLALVVSVLMMTGATLEQWGRTYGAEWAYRAALRVQPWRLSATERLAIALALDGRAGNAAAGAEARQLIGDAVAARPWNVDVRVWAAEVDALLNDQAGKQAWLDQQIARFPSEATSLRDARAEHPVIAP